METTTTTQTVNASAEPDIFRSPGPLDFVLFVALMLIGAFILLGNVLTILAILKTPQLRTQTNEFILHLSAADAIVGVAVLWLSFTFVIFTQFAFHSFRLLCVSGYVLTCLSSTQSILTLNLMAFDRLLYVERPYFYVRCITETLSKRILLCSWLFSLTFCALFVWYHSQVNPETGCILFHLLDNKGWYNYLFSLPVLIAVSVTGTCYIRISCIARHQRNKIRNDVRWVHNQQLQQSTTSSVSSARQSSPDGVKSTAMFVFINSVFAICWTPIAVCSLIPSGVYNSPAVTWCVRLLAISNSGVNLIVYSWKNKQLARAYKKLLCKCFYKQEF